MSDRMVLRLRVRAVVGCYDWEKELRREIPIEVELPVDCRAAGRDDDLAAALNYEPLVKALVGFAEGGDFDLVEALAEGAARICLEATGVPEVTVRVKKREALPCLDEVEIAIRRTRADYP